MRLMAYNYTAQWHKGSKNDASDTLLHHPRHDPEITDALAELDMNDDPEMSVAEIRAVRRWPTLRKPTSTRNTQTCRTRWAILVIAEFILNGFPKHHRQLPESCKRYWNVHQHLNLDDGLLVYGCRLLIPSTMRKHVLDNLHKAHQGVLTCSTNRVSTMTLKISYLPIDTAKTTSHHIQKNR